VNHSLSWLGSDQLTRLRQCRKIVGKAVVFFPNEKREGGYTMRKNDESRKA